MKTIALFGGSFDPPHIGHEAIVKSLLDFKEIDEVVVMPTFLNPFKEISHAPSQIRFKWLEDIFSEFENVNVSGYEAGMRKKVPTIQTVKHLLKRYKKIYLVVGADNLPSIDRWEGFEELKELVTIVVATREDFVIDENFLKLDIDVNISSTQLRKNIDISKLPKKCAKEIEKFYKEKNDRQNRKDNTHS